MLIGVGLFVLMLACQVVPTPPPLTPIPPTQGALVGGTPTRVSVTEIPTPSAPTPKLQNTPPNQTGGLPPFPPPDAAGFSQLQPTTWDPSPYTGMEIELPHPLDDTVNRPVIEGLTLSQRAFLEGNGFVVIEGREGQFSDLRMRVASQYGQPYYLSTDAAYYALLTNLREFVPALEREVLHPRMLAITQAVYQELLTYLPVVQGTALEEDALLATAYMGVALRLFDPGAELDPVLALLVKDQLEQIEAAHGIETSSLIPGFQDDYRAYQPTGHYAGDSLLGSYYRAMTWYGRVHFPVSGDVLIARDRCSSPWHYAGH